MTAERAIQPDGEALPEIEQWADTAIAACGGDARAAVIALFGDIELLQAELESTRRAVSFGWSRGWHRNGGDSK